MGVRMMDLLSGNLDTLRYEPTAKRVRVAHRRRAGRRHLRRPAGLGAAPRRSDLCGADHRADGAAGARPVGARSRSRPARTARRAPCPAISSRPDSRPDGALRRRTRARAPRSTSSRAKRPAPRRRSGPTTPTSPTTSSSSSPRSNGARRTNRWSATRMTRSAASTSCAAAATSASNSTAGCSPNRTGRCCCSKRCCRSGSICLARTWPSGSQPSDTATYCAYKGRASYYSVPDGPRDVAWTYHEPLHDAEPVRDRICFFDERVDVIVDGKRRDRPVTPWSDE